MTFLDIFTILGIFTIFFHFYLKFWQLWTKEGWSQAGPMGRKLEVMAQQAPRRLLAHILPLLKMQWWWQCFLVCCRLPQWHNLKDGQDLPSCHISRSCGWPILCFLDGQYFAVTFPIQSHLLAHIKFHLHVVAWTFYFSRDIAKCIASLIIWHWTAAFVWPGQISGRPVRPVWWQCTNFYSADPDPDLPSDRAPDLLTWNFCPVLFGGFSK